MSLPAGVKPRTYKLATVVLQPGGRSDAELLERADATLSAMKTKMLGPFDAALEELAEMAATSAPGPDDVYRRALVVSELGPLVGYAQVGRASFLLCDWLELAANNPAALQRGLRLHVDAMRALRRETTPSSEQTALVKALELMAEQLRATVDAR